MLRRTFKQLQSSSFSSTIGSSDSGSPLSSAPAPSSPGDATEEATMVRGPRLADVAAACLPTDIIFARRIKNRGANFFAWPGQDITDVATGMLEMPKSMRTIHAIFGRTGTPLDLVMVVDEKINSRAFRSAIEIRAHQRKELEKVMDVTHEALAAKQLRLKSQVVLTSPTLDKISFHVHIKLDKCAFQDVSHLGAFVRSHITPKAPLVDAQIYRNMGMLRIFQSMKENMESPMSVYDDEAFQVNIAKSSKRSLDNPVGHDAEDVMLHSFVMSPPGSYDRFVELTAEEIERGRHVYSPVRGMQRDGSTQARPLMPLTYSEALLNVKAWVTAFPPDLADTYSDWVKVGLHLRRIADEMEGKITTQVPGLDSTSPQIELLKAWINFSKMCPGKYRAGDCERRWNTLRPQSGHWFNSYCALAGLVPQY